MFYYYSYYYYAVGTEEQGLTCSMFNFLSMWVYIYVFYIKWRKEEINKFISGYRYTNV